LEAASFHSVIQHLPVMATTLVLESTNDSDLHLLLSLAQRLGVKATATPSVAVISEEERRRRFLALAGSWQSDESGDEINKMLTESRHFRDRDVEL
jgi:hypothetical protein